MECSDTVFR